jgi:outer membrane protein assembly factor BamB
MDQNNDPTFNFSATDDTASRRSFLQSCLGALVASTVRPAFGAPAAVPGASELLTKPHGTIGLSDFTFFHFSDSHIDPRLDGAPFNPLGRSVQALAWIAENSGRRIRQNQYNVRAEPPHFAIHTGDVFEYSVIDQTWSDWESAAARFRCPIAPVPGNHDNTWGEINRELRQRFGDDSYSFDYAGCHFVCLNSAGLLDPLPAWDRRTLNWLATDLNEVDHQTPVFVAMHHPLSGDAGYASPFDKLRFWDVIQHHNVVLMMDGHWHTVHHQQWQGLDRVNGGATFGTHTGYSSVTLRDETLRVVFHYWQENETRPQGRAQVPLVEKKLARQRIERPFTARPVENSEVAFGKPVTSRVELEASADVSATAWIDGANKSAAKLVKKGSRLSRRLGTKKLTPGWHYITLRVQPPNDSALDFSDSFWLNPPPAAPYKVHRFQGAAAIKTQPIVAGEMVFVGDTAGIVAALSLDLKPVWKYSTGSQIVHSLAVADGLVIVGDVDGVVHALRATSGERAWKRQLPNAIYAAAAIAGATAVVADAAGWLHALRVETGKTAWSVKVADFGFEARPLVHDDLLFAGAWDGRLYALRHATGKVDWKAWCPTWHTDMKSRYYAPADASPVIVQDHVLTTDRGYRLGRYTREGEYLGLVRGQVSAVAASAEGDAFYTRGLDNQLVKHAANGTVLWSRSTPLGRAPTAPLVCGERVAVVSDTGLLYVADAASGDELCSLSMSPSLFVLSGLGGDSAHHLFAADMDGRLTGVQLDPVRES